MFNFSFVRMAGALKIHLHPILISSKLVKQFFESVKIILENVKIFLLVVNKSISYLLFRVYSMEQLMIKAATTMAAARMKRAETEKQFIIPRSKENSWGHRRVLDKEKIIRVLRKTLGDIEESLTRRKLSESLSDTLLL